MKQFLQETIELGWWALFQPSLLRERMNRWAERGDEDAEQTVYLLYRHKRFAPQFLLLVLLLMLPLAVAVAFQGQAGDWLFVLSALLSTYGISVWIMSLGLQVPLLFALVYIYRVDSIREALNTTLAFLPPLPQLGLGIGVFTLGLGLTTLISYYSWQRQQIMLGRALLIGGVVCSVALGSWLATQNWGVMLLLASLTGMVALLLVRDEPQNNDPEQAVVLAVVLAGVLAVGLAVGLAGGLAGGLVGLVGLPLPPLLLAAWLLGFGLAPLSWRWSGLVLAGVFVALAVERQSWWALAAGAAAALAGFYRLLPFYPVLLLSSLSGRERLLGGAPSPALPLLQRLPPFGDEVLWLPLPGHSQILAAALREDASATLPVLQRMRTAPYPGYQYTVRRALPQLVADQLAQVQNVSSLAAIARPEHPVLPLLVPSFYPPDEAEQQAAPAAQPASDELAITLPRFRAIADDTGRALESANPALVERGLERCLANLRTLQGQFPGLGLKNEQIRRWQPVFDRWEKVLQATITHQRTLSQGEVRNPFQTGNPLRPERKELFKGRTQFVSDVLRYIYDASRPTLVLHGPRRCGKSSFLLNLPRLLPKDVLPVYSSLQAPAATGSTGDFCYGLVGALQRDLRGQGQTLPTAQRSDFQANPYVALEDWLNQALPRLGSRSVLLCFDEFEQLGVAVAKGQVDMQVFDQLRELIQHSSLSFLFCGVQTLDELGPNWSSYFISVQPMEMTYLEPDAAHELLTNPDPAFDLRYDHGIVDQVISMTQCQPYLLQLIGEQMVRQANRQQTRLLTAPLLEAAFDTALTAGTPYFTNLWTEYTGTTPDEIRAGQALLHAIAHGQPLPASNTPAARAALRRLQRYHVIAQVNGAYRCEVPLVARWVRERALLEEDV